MDDRQAPALPNLPFSASAARHRESAARLWRDLVAIESHTPDLAGCARGLDRLAEFLRDLGFGIVEHRHPCGRPEWVAHAPGTPAEPAPGGVAWIGHIDTVYPADPEQPAGITVSEEGRWYGPGVADMKGGLSVMALAAATLADLGRLQGLPLRIVVVSDEETGTEAGAELVRREAALAKATLTYEAGQPRHAASTIVTSRRGHGLLKLAAHGESAHAGVDPRLGRNAVMGLARRLIAAESAIRHLRGVSFCVGRLAGGTATNTVPDYAEAWCDLRWWDAGLGEELQRIILGKLNDDSPQDDIRIETLSHHVRVPLVRDAASGRLAERAIAIGEGLGQQLVEDARGGSSDAALAAAAGTPSICGLGIIGDRFHRKGEEWADPASLVPRAALSAALTLDLLRRSS